MEEVANRVNREGEVEGRVTRRRSELRERRKGGKEERREMWLLKRKNVRGK